MNEIEDRIRDALKPYRLEAAAPRLRDSLPASRRRRVGWMVGAAAAVAAVAVLLFSLLPVGSPGGPDPAVASLLHRFEQVARNTPPEEVPEPGQYVYSKTRSTESYVFVSGDGDTRFVYSVPLTSQRWLGLDGSGRMIDTAGQPSFPTQVDRAAYEAFAAEGSQEALALQADWDTTNQQTYAPGELTWRDTSNLPTDPDQLAELIEGREIVGGPAGDAESFVLAADLLRDSYARPELRAALYAYMAGLSGIELLGKTTDEAGRTGVALASTNDNGLRQEVIFDRATGLILEERFISVDSEEGSFEDLGSGKHAYARAGDPSYIATYLSFGRVVDTMETSEIASST